MPSVAWRRITSPILMQKTINFAGSAQLSTALSRELARGTFMPPYEAPLTGVPWSQLQYLVSPCRPNAHEGRQYWID
jgi:hypothetical protein